MSDTTILDWKLIRLTLDQIGPFQEAMQSFDFVEGAPPKDEKPRPANLYMLLAKNGAGKTTILESIHGLFGLLADPPVGRFTDLRNTGRVQADFRVRWRRDRREETVLLSMWLGSNDPLLTPDTVNLEGVTADTEWVRIALGRNVGGAFLMDGSSPAGIEIWRDIREQIGAAPTALMGASQGLPTVLFFPADRTVFPPCEASGVERPLSWGYQPAQIFSADGPEWRNSIVPDHRQGLEQATAGNSDGVGDHPQRAASAFRPQPRRTGVAAAVCAHRLPYDAKHDSPDRRD
jgi:hypothetical protein